MARTSSRRTVPKLTEEDYAALGAFRHALRKFMAFSEAGARAHGLTAQQHQALLAIRTHAGEEPMSIGELAECLLIKNHSAVGLVGRLQDRGLVVRRISAELRPGVLQPMSIRSVLLRLQNNIKIRRLRAGNLQDALACTEDMLRIAPEQAALWREAALMNQRLDRVAAALRCFEHFLVLVPEGESAARARLAIDELRARLN